MIALLDRYLRASIAWVTIQEPFLSGTNNIFALLWNTRHEKRPRCNVRLRR